MTEERFGSKGDRGLTIEKRSLHGKRFSSMKHIQTTYYLVLSSQYLPSFLLRGSTDFEPQFDLSLFQFYKDYFKISGLI